MHTSNTSYNSPGSRHNHSVSHPLQSFEWGEFRSKTGVKVIRVGGKETFQITIHSIPKTPFTIGYLPKGNVPTRELITDLREIGGREKCIFIQLEPNVIKRRYINQKGKLEKYPIEQGSGDLDKKLQMIGLIPSARPLFTKYTFSLDLTKSDEELLANMHAKTRYNIRVAEKRGVSVQESSEESDFEEYLRLTKETTVRQKFYAHSEKYHRLQWEILQGKITDAERQTVSGDELSSHLLLAKYQKKILAAWIVFVFKDTLYYPYGASSSENREVMASNLLMWQTILFGKKLGLKKFDMWGALSPEPDTSDPWYGFHKFKMGYGADLIEFVGSFDLVLKPVLYQGYKTADKLRWFLLRLKS